MVCWCVVVLMCCCLVGCCGFFGGFGFCLDCCGVCFVFVYYDYVLCVEFVG